jgi:hypothetical protein
MSLREWSGLRVFGAALGWFVLVLLVGLFPFLQFFFGRERGSKGGVVGISIGSDSMPLLLVAAVPAVILVGAWVWQRLH